jgi:hypothetical protein
VVSEERRSVGPPTVLAAGAVIGAGEVVLAISFAALEAEEPRSAATLHRWFAGALAERLTDRMKTLDSLLD